MFVVCLGLRFFKENIVEVVSGCVENKEDLVLGYCSLVHLVCFLVIYFGGTFRPLGLLKLFF